MTDRETDYLGLVGLCLSAVLAGCATVTISATGKRPPGFPRGELLSVNAAGVHNYAVCPIKVLAWIHKKTAARRSPPPLKDEKT